MGCREPGPPLDRCLFRACPAESQVGRQGSPAQTASPRQPPFLEASLSPLNPGVGGAPGCLHSSQQDLGCEVREKQWLGTVEVPPAGVGAALGKCSVTSHLKGLD